MSILNNLNLPNAPWEGSVNKFKLFEDCSFFSVNSINKSFPVDDTKYLLLTSSITVNEKFLEFSVSKIEYVFLTSEMYP